MLVSIGGVVCALLLLGTAFRLSETRTPAVSRSNCPLPGVQTCQACIQSVRLARLPPSNASGRLSAA